MDLQWTLSATFLFLPVPPGMSGPPAFLGFVGPADSMLVYTLLCSQLGCSLLVTFPPKDVFQKFIGNTPSPMTPLPFSVSLRVCIYFLPLLSL